MVGISALAVVLRVAILLSRITKVYERGIASNPHSVDLWAEYCRFKMDTCHNLDAVRE